MREIMKGFQNLQGIAAPGSYTYIYRFQLRIKIENLLFEKL